MSGKFGCAGMIAGVFALIGLVLGIVIALSMSGSDLTERIIVVGCSVSMPAACAFVAAFALMFKDEMKFKAVRSSVRNKLLSRHDVLDQQLQIHFPAIDPQLIVQTRQAIALFFNVPPQKIHPTDDVRADLKLEALEPSFHAFVIFKFFEWRKVLPETFTFNTNTLVDIGDLANEVQRVMNDIRMVSPKGGPE